MLLSILSAFFFTEMKDMAFKARSNSLKMEHLLNKLELPGLIVLSFVLQFVLVIYGRWQRYRGSNLVSTPQWLADWVANVALAVIFKKEKRELISRDIIMLWIPFLFLHLGGPDSVSADHSDDALWKKYLLGLCIQVGVAVNVCKSFGINSIPTYMAIPMFITGIIKYGERIWILRAASWKQFSKSSIFSARRPFFLAHPPSQNHPTDDPAKRLDEYLESKGVIQEGKNIHKAFYLYKMFIPLSSDLKIRINKDLTQKIILRFMSIKSEDAFKLVQMELGFLYDALYTKTTILRSRVGVILRSICLLSTFSALIAFSIIVGKSSYHKPNIAMTYMLLTGALFLDVFSIILHVLSNWTMFHLTIVDNTVHKFIGSRRVSQLIRYGGDKKEMMLMAQHSLIDYCFKVKTSRWTKMVRFIDTEDILAKFWWTSWKPVSLELKMFIHSSLREKHDDKYRKRELFHYQSHLDLLTSKGKLVLEREDVLETIKWSFEDVEFSHSVLLWHSATFLLFHDDRRRKFGGALDSYCQISKQLSDYMMYLLLVRPLMLPKGSSEVRIRETREEVLRFFNQPSLQTESGAANALLHDIKFSLRIEKLPNVNQVQSMSVLSDGCKLACQLQALVEELLWDDEEKWKMIADVWMEMLLFAASKCEWREHATQMKNCEELLTHLALLMVHFGLTEHIRIVDGPKKEDIQSNRVEPNSVWQPEAPSNLRWDWELSHLAYCVA